jgi:hypothetical protein
MVGPSAAFAQAQSTGQPHEDLTKLAEEFTDPLTTLPQVFFRDYYTPANYGTNAQLNRALVRAIIPRLPRFSLFPFVQLVRPTFDLVTVPTYKRGMTRTGFGDIDLFDLAVCPGRMRKSGSRSESGQRSCSRPRPPKPRAGRMAGRSGMWSSLHRRFRAFGRPPFSESDFLRLHLAQSQACQHDGVSADCNRPRLERLVRKIRRFNLGI